MSCGVNQPLKSCQGKLFTASVKVTGDSSLSYAAIDAITATNPPTITATAHGVPHGWPVVVVSSNGMTEINCENNPPENDDWHFATVTSANALTLNDVLAADYSAYTGGGYLQFYTPRDLSGEQATFIVYDEEGGTALLTLTSSPASGVVLDNTTKTITATIDGASWDDLPEGRYYYEFSLLMSGYTSPYGLASGSFTVS